MTVAFPSKLTDYTASGVPILIWGPPWCSAVRFAQDHPGSAEVIQTTNPREVSAAIARLASDPVLRHRLGQAALDIGNQLFSPRAVTAEFRRQLEAAASGALASSHS